MGDIDVEVISATENSNKFPKSRFWKEKSVEDVVTLGLDCTHATSLHQKYLDAKEDLWKPKISQHAKI